MRRKTPRATLLPVRWLCCGLRVSQRSGRRSGGFFIFRPMAINVHKVGPDWLLAIAYRFDNANALARVAKIRYLTSHRKHGGSIDVLD
ncbi:hypothetical protein [Cronobacter turicensis]|uniref:hypothetical protein n=1 Tax=Cronobacter turicensis TaxID=413502 RepID=UPI0011AD1D4A|nr:hypothetical protein [Cronobacter turicensis]TWR35749.1 hypothetical protein FQY85_04195 [Cronobacter turicensis]